MRTIETENYIKISQLMTGNSLIGNPLNGKSNQQARRIVNKIIPNTPGFFSDQSWEAVNRIWQAFEEANLDWAIVDSQYYKDERGVPIGKNWKVEIYFDNNKGKRTVLYGIVQASGAGSVDDPLSKYDITAYVG